jgi:hypothetical protein
MKKKRSSVEQIVALIKQVELGTSVADLARRASAGLPARQFPHAASIKG